jgi:hypothetical protein
MNLKEKTAEKRQGLIIAAVMENQNQSNNQDPDRSSNDQDDGTEIGQDDSPFTNPDPDLEDPNLKPDRNQEQEESDLEEYTRDENHGRDRDDLIDPIDPLNSVSDQYDSDPDNEDQLELDDDEIDEPDENEEAPVEEKDDLDRATPLDLPEEGNLEERDFSLET